MGSPPRNKPIAKDSFADILEMMKHSNPFSPRATPSPTPVTNRLARQELAEQERTAGHRNLSAGILDLIDLESDLQQTVVATSPSSPFEKNCCVSGANDIEHDCNRNTQSLQEKGGELPVLEGLLPRHVHTLPLSHRPMTPASSHEDKLEHLLSLCDMLKEESTDVTPPNTTVLEVAITDDAAGHVTEHQGNGNMTKFGELAELFSASLPDKINQPQAIDSELAALKTDLAALKTREIELLAKIDHLKSDLGEAQTQNLFLSTQNTQLKGKAAQSSPNKNVDLEAKLKDEITKASRVQNENHQLKQLIRTKDASLKTNEASVATLQKVVDRISDSGKMYRSAAHLVQPSAQANIPRLVLGCMECYAKNQTCDNKARCQNCIVSGATCQRWRCSQVHVLKQCTSSPCRLYHNSDGWVMTKHERTEW